MFEVDPENYDAMRLFGAKYVISSEYSKQFSELKDNPHYRLLGSTADVLQSVRVSGRAASVQLGRKRRGCGGAARRGSPRIERSRCAQRPAGSWPCTNSFFPAGRRRSTGKVRLSNRGRARSRQSAVPAGEHTVEFRYRSRLLGVGGGISLIALIGLGFWIRASSRSRSDTACRAVSG